MIADDLKRLEIKGAFAEGYQLYAWDADAEEYMPVTGYVISADGLRVELQTDSDGEAIDAHADQPQAVSAVALSDLRMEIFDALAESRVKVVRECDGEEMDEDVEAWSTREQYDLEQYTEAVMAALAAHDQKVRAEAFAEAANHKYSHGRNGAQCSCGLQFEGRADTGWPEHIRSLAAPAASKPEAGKTEP